MWLKAFTLVLGSAIMLHCCKSGDNKKDIDETENKDSIGININDSGIIVLGEYEKNLHILMDDSSDYMKDYDYTDEKELENLQIWEEKFNLTEESLLRKVKNNSHSEYIMNEFDCSNHQLKFARLKSYMSKNCLKDFDIFLSMNHEDEWEKYHNEIMQLETQYRKWERNNSENDLIDLSITTTEWVVPPM